MRDPQGRSRSQASASARSSDPPVRRGRVVNCLPAARGQAEDGGSSAKRGSEGSALPGADNAEDGSPSVKREARDSSPLPSPSAEDCPPSAQNGAANSPPLRKGSEGRPRTDHEPGTAPPHLRNVPRNGTTDGVRGHAVRTAEDLGPTNGPPIPGVENLAPELEKPLEAWERRGLWAVVVGLVLFGCLVEFRSALLHFRKGDLGVFLRTAWAVRSGADLYAVTDDNGFHYLYPPLFAIVLTPLADPPAGADRTGTLPYPVSVVICYLLNVVCLVVAVHLLAGVLEERSANPAVRARPPAGRRWWALRLLPVLACLPAVGHTLMRGQVGLLLLLLLCGMLADFLRGRPFRAGLWLAGAICLKVIPAFLLLYPLWRRDARALAGAAAGLALGLLVVPAAVLGPVRTVRCYQRWTEVMLLPTLGQGEDRSRAKELHEMTATDSQSLLVLFHNSLYPERTTRPPTAAPAARVGSLLAGGLLTLGTLAVAGRRRRGALAETTFVSMLVLLMLLLSPVCHLHYFCLSVIPVMALLAWAWETDQRLLRPGLAAFFAVNIIANALPHFPGLELVRDLGLAAYAALLLWLLAALRLRQQTRPVAVAETEPVGAAA